MQSEHSRRSFLAAALASAALAPKSARAQRDWSGKEPVRYPDPDVVALDKRFAKYKVNNTQIRRLRTGMLWAEGPAWSGAGRYLVWSDIPNNAQMRWLEEDGHISTYRNPSGYSNGNTFDYQGRLLSCEHLNRRVVRYETDGTVTVLADKWNGKPLNAPNDIVVHPDGGIWFTDPGYGILAAYEGSRAEMQLRRSGVPHRWPDGQDGKSAGRDVQAQRAVLLARLQEALHRGYGFHTLSGSAEEYTRVRRRGRAHAPQWPRVRRHQAGHLRWYSRRCGWQYLGGLRLGGRGVRWRIRVHARGRAHRSYSAAGDMRKFVFRREQAQPAVHGREPIAIRGICGNARGVHIFAGRASLAVAADRGSGIGGCV